MSKRRKKTTYNNDQKVALLNAATRKNAEMVEELKQRQILLDRAKDEYNYVFEKLRNGCYQNVLYIIERIQPIIMETENIFVFSDQKHVLKKVNLPEKITPELKKTMMEYKVKIETMTINIKLYPIKEIIRPYENLIFRAMAIGNAIEEHVLGWSFDYEKSYTRSTIDQMFVHNLFEDKKSEIYYKNSYYYIFQKSEIEGLGLPKVKLPDGFMKTYEMLVQGKKALQDQDRMRIEQQIYRQPKEENGKSEAYKKRKEKDRKIKREALEEYRKKIDAAKKEKEKKKEEEKKEDEPVITDVENNPETPDLNMPSLVEIE